LATKEELQHWKMERLEGERREDVVRERDLWINAVLTLLGDGGNAIIAIDKADAVLAAYRGRFQ